MIVYLSGVGGGGGGGGGETALGGLGTTIDISVGTKSSGA